MSSLDYILEAVKRSVSSVDPAATEKLIDLIVSSKTDSKTIFVFGVGRSGLSGQFFCVRLVQMGLDVHFIGDMTTPVIRKGDLTILVSNTGKTMSATYTANIAGRVGSKVVSITSNADSNLANASDLVIHLPASKDKERSSNAPLGTVFEESSNLFFDSIVPLIMKKLNMTESDMRKRHAIWV
jgi:6-phospho-3-hexuloisomerase